MNVKVKVSSSSLDSLRRKLGTPEGLGGSGSYCHYGKLAASLRASCQETNLYKFYSGPLAKLTRRRYSSSWICIGNYVYGLAPAGAGDGNGRDEDCAEVSDTAIRRMHAAGLTSCLVAQIEGAALVGAASDIAHGDAGEEEEAAPVQEMKRITRGTRRRGRYAEGKMMR
jgi:hypothetical protein